MRGHLGAVLTSGLAAVALALALLQAIVIAYGSDHAPETTAARSGATNRYSVPGGRSGIPFLPFENRQNDQGQTPPRQEERHAPTPPARMRAVPPRIGPQQPRKLAA